MDSYFNMILSLCKTVYNISGFHRKYKLTDLRIKRDKTEG